MCKIATKINQLFCETIKNFYVVLLGINLPVIKNKLTVLIMVNIITI